MGVRKFECFAMAIVRSPNQKSKLLATSPGQKSVPTAAVGLRVRRGLVAAMEQQMWFFGCDAACADGNLLVRYGFQRYRQEVQPGESSSYSFFWRPPADKNMPVAQVDLHGWCAALHPLGSHRTEGGFLYVRARNRIGWYDAVAPPAPGEYDEQAAARQAFRSLGRSPEAGFCRAAARFLGWIEEYEGWIEAACGPGYRRRCFGRAPLPWLPPNEARDWLGRYCQEITRFVCQFES